jgi:predicted RNA binding protein YcfA (HicA-like mRNA interferase family)
MRLPRDLSGAQLVKQLQIFGYTVTRQTGSHIRLTCSNPTQHHVTIPSHDPLRIGTLAVILDSVANHHGLNRQALLKQLLD